MDRIELFTYTKELRYNNLNHFLQAHSDYMQTTTQQSNLISQQNKY